MQLNRRRMLALGASAVVAGPAVVARAAAAGVPAALQAAADRFSGLPATTSLLVVAGHPDDVRWQVAHDPSAHLFVGSAIKTFILAQFLRDVENGRLDEMAQEKIDDSVRSLDSPVFANLTGTTLARNVLEAMIAHSDNTATDVTIAAVGPDRVRALIAEADLTNTQIPDSTRRLISYLSGAPPGVDIGWVGCQKIADGGSFGPDRTMLNDQETMASTAEEMVSWYQQALAGAFFKKPETLKEFKRIHGMADAVSAFCPPDTVAYAKSGSINWGDEHAVTIPGQMLVDGIPVTFSGTINWTGPQDGVPAMRAKYAAAWINVLAEAAKAVRG